MGLTDDDIDALRGLERAMWTSATRDDREWMERHLAGGFTEFGRSGRAHTREQILAMPIGAIDAELDELEVRAVGADVALVTYRSTVRGEIANRSSVWRRTDDGWRLEFHQGTPVSAS